jgi:hypothetical protein
MTLVTLAAFVEKGTDRLIEERSRPTKNVLLKYFSRKRQMDKIAVPSRPE